MRLNSLLLLSLVILAGCGQQPAVTDSMRRVNGSLPVDYSGSWQRNYARDDEVGRALQQAYYELARTSPDYTGGPGGYSGPTQRDADTLVAMARLGELITRSDVLTITQDDREVRVEREEDFSLVCRFQDGSSQTVGNAAGAEVCGWDGEDLVSMLKLADNLEIVHRFTISEDRQQLRVVTTISAPGSRVPFTLRRFYQKFDRPASGFHCIETLSQHRVCSTREIEE